MLSLVTGDGKCAFFFLGFRDAIFRVSNFLCKSRSKGDPFISDEDRQTILSMILFRVWVVFVESAHKILVP